MRIQQDKVKHFVVGFFMGIILPFAGMLMLADYPIIYMAISFGIIVQVGFGFELFSLITGKGHAEIMDAVATVIGGVIGLSIYFIYLKFT